MLFYYFSLYWKRKEIQISGRGEGAAAERKENMAKAHMTVEDLILNLQVAGFEKDEIELYLSWWKKGDMEKQLALLSEKREVLLKRVHEEEKRIFCLDYLVYQIGREDASTAG